MRTPIKSLLFTAFFTGVLIGPVWAEMSQDEQAKVRQDMQNYRFKKVTTPEGLNFSIPEDMPIERKDGLVQPIAFDEYFYYKFKKMEEKLSDVDKKIDKLEKMLTSLEKKIKTPQETAVAPNAP